MSAPQMRWAHRVMAKIIASCGNVCNACGSDESLTIDLIVPDGGKHHGRGVIGRACYYLKEWRRGNRQCLCDSCNTRKGDTPNDEFFADLTQKRNISSSNTSIKPGGQCEQPRNSLAPG